MKQKPDPGKARAMVAARAILAITLLLTLVSGSIGWPAAASGPLCTLSCCAGRAPHAAGSCMHGSCEAGISTHSPVKNSGHAAHHHHEQQAAEASNQSGPFAGATASAGGSETGEVPTIEAAPYEASATDDTLTETTESASNGRGEASISATVLSKPCQYDCGSCTSGFGAPKRPRNAAVLVRSHHALTQSSGKLTAVRYPLTHASSPVGRQSVPRGPPSTFL